MLKMLFLVKNAEISSNGVPIYLRLRINQTKSEISTGVRISPDFWNVDSKRVVAPRGSNAQTKELVKSYNDVLSQLERKARIAYGRLSDTQDILTAQQIKNEILGTDKNKTIGDAPRLV